MPDGFRFPVSVCIAASVFGTNTTSGPTGSWTFGWSGFCPLIRSALFHHASAEAERRRPKFAPGPWITSSGWIGTRSHLALEELNLIAEAVRRFLDSSGDRQATGDLDELREAIDRVEAYQDFQPDRFDRRTLNRQLRLLAQDREVRR